MSTTFRVGSVRRFGAVLASAAVIVAACSAAPATQAPATQAPATQAPATQAPATQAPATPVQTTGEPRVLVTGWVDLGTMDWSPAGSGGDNEKVIRMWGDTLTDEDPETHAIVGELAESYSLSDDGLTWTFNLRPNIPFHDGWGTVTSEDVKFTWQEWISPESTHGRRDQISRVVGGDMNNFEIVSDLEFRIHTVETRPDLPEFLSNFSVGMTISSKRYHEEMGDAANQHPIGSGPWKYVSSIPGEEIVLDAVPDHWNQPPAFDRLVMRLIDDGAARLLQVQSGDVDLAVLESDLVGEAQAAGLQILPIPQVSSVFVVLGGSYHGSEALDRDSPWIQADEPAKGLAIREAMSLAIDRQLILDQVLSGFGAVAHGPLLQYPGIPELTDPSWSLPVFDVEQARQKLAEGGYPDGFPIELFQYRDDIDTIAVGEAIAGMWEEIGIQVTRNPADEAILEEKEDNRDTGGLAWVKLAGYTPDPAARLSSYLNANQVGLPMTHPAIDDAFNQLGTETDRDTRFAIARDLINVLRNEVIGIPLFVADQLFVAGPRVGGWSPMQGSKEWTRLETVQPAD